MINFAWKYNNHYRYYHNIIVILIDITNSEWNKNNVIDVNIY